MLLQKKYSFLIFLLTAATLYACTKGDDSPAAVTSTANINVINAVSDVKAIDFYLDGTRQNNNSAIYFLGTSGYTQVPSGEQQYQFKVDTDRALLADIKLNLPKADSDYTLLLTGQKNAGNLTPILLSDAYTDTVAAKAKVRFVQASPGPASYDVFLGDTVSYLNRAFKSATGFVRVGAGKKTLRITPAGSATAIFTGTVTLQQNTYYTLFTVGVPNGSGSNAFSAGLILNR